jgi:tRNA 5-methylaminomethyl-2-thiouridine biosynthesis bifunctional protein
VHAVERWRGRERFTVFDAGYGDGSATRALIDAWRADPQRPFHLHLVALSDRLMPGVHRIPQPDAGVTLDLVSGPPDAALAQLVARVDLFRLHGLIDAGEAFARPLARVAAHDATLEAQGLSPAQTAALASAGFLFNEDASLARFASRKPRPPLPFVP